MKSALHAFVAYMSHYHSVEWNNYMENQTPSSVNDLYKVGWKDYASKVFVDKPETWKKWNTIHQQLRSIRILLSFVIH